MEATTDTGVDVGMAMTVRSVSLHPTVTMGIIMVETVVKWLSSTKTAASKLRTQAQTTWSWRAVEVAQEQALDEVCMDTEAVMTMKLYL